MPSGQNQWIQSCTPDRMFRREFDKKADGREEELFDCIKNDTLPHENLEWKGMQRCL